MNELCGVVSLSGDRIDLHDWLGMVRVQGSYIQGEGEHLELGAAGLAVSGGRDGLCGLARQSVHGNPVTLAFCGNVVNTQELGLNRCSLKEVIAGLLQMYLDEGLGCVQRWRGEYAFALWDGSQSIFCVGTDRFRTQPIFYAVKSGVLKFASRLKTLGRGGSSGAYPIDHHAIIDVMAFSSIPTPRTIYQGIAKLPPGNLLVIRQGNISISQYWAIDFLKPDGRSAAELSEELREVFSDSVRARVRSEKESTRIGAFLSGGIDSSTVTGVLTALTGKPIETFSIGFAEEGFNEIGYARIAAQAFGSKHHEYFVTAQDTIDAISMLAETFDEPFANASAVPTYFCARLAKSHGVDVLYAGDGGDELFAGNERYRTQKLFDYYGSIPAWMRTSVLEPLLPRLAGVLPCKLSIGAHKYMQRARVPYPERLVSYGFFNVVPPRELFEREFMAAVGNDYDPYEPLKRCYRQAPAREELDKQLYVDLQLIISDNDLLKVMRASQAAGVAVRFPFLDHYLAEFAGRVPARTKMRGAELRTFFKSAYAALLPLQTRRKSKHGFGLPIPVWLRTNKILNDMMSDLVLSRRSIQRGYFKQSMLEDIVARHRTDTTSFYGTVLWNIMIIELWHRRYWDAPASS